jgi:hypothetical protein
MFKIVAQPSVAYCQALLAELEALTTGEDAAHIPRVWVQHSEGGLTFTHSDLHRVCQVNIWGAVSVELTRAHYVDGSSCIGMSTEQVKDAAKKIFDFMAE